MPAPDYDDFFDVSQNALDAEKEELEEREENFSIENEEEVTLFKDAPVSPDHEDTEEAEADEVTESKVSLEEDQSSTSIEKAQTADKKEIKEISVKAKENLVYPAISYIEQKLKNMQTQYPSIEVSEEMSPELKTWLEKIAKEGCTEEEVVQTIVTVDAIKEERSADAAQLLLACAATPSKYAHFRLARALYTGEILRKDSPEAFTIINRLALNEDYPEAICDLAQFYEHGIGIGQDRKKAEKLYREAMEAGIKRAEAHVQRLEKGSRKRFSFFRK